ncbi:hypothetical protein INT47_005169 [Mucor saturninus]|uniref:Uncharacterized protein n=1 Tax=Mucor saturninus TaxID=64648 RepID=A0A8H7V338_9FUNG|nr:hypothetical protein INT47_005169 [Mucor saturninus]
MDQFVAAMFIFDSKKEQYESTGYAKNLDNYDDVISSSDFSNLLRHCKEASKQTENSKTLESNPFSTAFVNLVECLRPTIKRIEETVIRNNPSNCLDDETSYVTAPEFPTLLETSEDVGEDYPGEHLMPGTYIEEANNVENLTPANKNPYEDSVSMSNKNCDFDEICNTRDSEVCSSDATNVIFKGTSNTDKNTTNVNDTYYRDPGSAHVPTIIPNSNKEDRSISYTNRSGDTTPTGNIADKNIYCNGKDAASTVISNAIIDTSNQNRRKTLGTPSASYYRMKLISQEIDELKNVIDTNIHLFHTSSLDNDYLVTIDGHTTAIHDKYEDVKFGINNNPDVMNHGTYVNIVSPDDRSYYEIYPKDREGLGYNATNSMGNLYTNRQNAAEVIPNSTDPKMLVRIEQLEQLEHDIEGQLDDMTTYLHNHHINVTSNTTDTRNASSKLSRPSSLIQVGSDEFKLNYLIDTAVAKALENSYNKLIEAEPTRSKPYSNSNLPLLEVYPLLQQEPDQLDSTQPPQDSLHEKRRKETISFYVEQLTLLFYPLLLTNPLMFYDELPTDSISVRLGGSVINAIAVVCGITIMTFFFVFCFKYRFYKDISVFVFLVRLIGPIGSRCNNLCVMNVRI